MLLAKVRPPASRNVCETPPLEVSKQLRNLLEGRLCDLVDRIAIQYEQIQPAIAVKIDKGRSEAHVHSRMARKAGRSCRPHEQPVPQISIKRAVLVLEIGDEDVGQPVA